MSATPATTPADGELLPCPCCGGAASFDHDDDGWNWIVCGGCGVSTDCVVSIMDDCRPGLRERWNRRATVSPAQAAPADGELLQRIADNDPSWVLKYLEQNTRFDVPRIRELFEFAKTQAVAALATPSPGKAPEPIYQYRHRNEVGELLSDAWMDCDVDEYAKFAQWPEIERRTLYASPGKAEAENNKDQE